MFLEPSDAKEITILNELEGNIGKDINVKDYKRERDGLDEDKEDEKALLKLAYLKKLNLSSGIYIIFFQSKIPFFTHV